MYENLLLQNYKPLMATQVFHAEPIQQLHILHFEVKEYPLLEDNLPLPNRFLLHKMDVPVLECGAFFRHTCDSICLFNYVIYATPISSYLRKYSIGVMYFNVEWRRFRL